MSPAHALTGGTNDVNPQPLKVRVSQTTSAAASIGVPIPVQRLTTGGRAQVLEILKIEYDLIGSWSTTAPGRLGYYLCLSSRSQNATVPTYGSADPYTIKFVSKMYPIYNGATSGTTYDCGTWDLTDGAGHGILYGLDTLYVQLQQDFGAGTFVSGSANFNIWYRWKNVGFSEYVGMVTSS